MRGKSTKRKVKVKYMWTEDLFRVKQPVIALLHLRALPGDPLFDKEGGLQNVIDIARRELHALQDGGVDGILFANEFSLPYQRKVDYVTVASMARVIGELRSEIAVPYGVNIASNPMAAIDLAVATNAQFVRAAFTGAYLSEAGIINTDVAQAVRRRLYLNHTDIKMLFKVNPESDVYLAARSLQKITKSILFLCFPDGLCVSGVSARSETDDDILKDVKAVADSVPVFCNTGCTAQNVAQKLSVVDGVCVGTAFKKDGKFENQVELQRVVEFMDAVRAYRATK